MVSAEYLVVSLIAGIVGFSYVDSIMGACVSTSSPRVRVRRKCQRRPKRLCQKVPSSVPVTDIAVSEIVHTATMCRRQEVSNPTLHLSQLQWHHSQIDATGMPFLLCRLLHLLYNCLPYFFNATELQNSNLIQDSHVRFQ